MSSDAKHGSNAATMGGLLVALGIIYGDIGTSPLYVLKAVIGEVPISAELVLGGLSCIFWTLTLQTTIKYVLFTLNADNKGEGGIFALYALVRRRAPRLMIPAIIGGSALLADGIITPPISVSSAVEGLRLIHPDVPTVPIVIFILIILFSVQHFGTSVVGKSFGPIMLVWFSMLSLLGLYQITHFPIMHIVSAINPWYGYQLIVEHPGGFWLLGAVFLCTTGAEALYSDLGHCGRGNIRVSWIFVKISLLLNYFGQGAWLLKHEGQLLDEQNPFYAIMPQWFLIVGIVIATLSTIIASQALISGTFTVVAEAMRLHVFPKVKVIYPTELRGQIYVPGANVFLLVGCIGIVLYFRESSNMEAAYGLAITLAMLSTTVLMGYYLKQRKYPTYLTYSFVTLFLLIEGGYLIANLKKFFHGGFVTLFIGAALFAVMWIWNKATKLKARYTEYVDLESYLPVLSDLSGDSTIPKFCTHLIYLTGAQDPDLIEQKIIYSILRKRPKRADVYWFVHVDVIDEPYNMEYRVTSLVPGRVFRIDFLLGFRVEPRINFFFRKVIEEMAERGEVDIESRYDSLRRYNIPGDFRFVVLEKSLSYENALPWFDQFIMDGYFALRRFSLSEERSFGLDTSSVITEKVPLLISPVKGFNLIRVEDGEDDHSSGPGASVN